MILDITKIKNFFIILDFNLFFCFYFLFHTKILLRNGLTLLFTFSKWLNGLILYFFVLFFFSPFNMSHKFNVTSSFMWLDFCTALHKCYWTFVHNYREKDEPNSSLSLKLLSKPFSLCWLLSTCPTSSFIVRLDWTDF